jgi:hypothetical protein
MISMRPPKYNSCRDKQAGTALLMVIFLVATMMLLTTTAVLRFDTQGRREREAELAWRGEQYQTAIGRYFRKFGKYPTKVDDLVKQTNGVRFLRQAYTDPMNKEDGSWRFIYVGPGGQLIGSLRRTSLLQNVVGMPMLPGASTPFGTGGNTTGAGGSATGAGGNTAGMGGSTFSAGGAFGQTGQQMNSAQGFNPGQGQPQSLQGQVIGGNIIGVASKVKESSLRLYQGGDTYEQWEFIWNPQTQIAIPAAPVAPTGLSGAPGLPPAQTTPGAAITSPDTSGGGNPPQNPPQNPPAQ